MNSLDTITLRRDGLFCLFSKWSKLWFRLAQPSSDSCQRKPKQVFSGCLWLDGMNTHIGWLNCCPVAQMLIVDVGTMHMGVALGAWLGVLTLGQIVAFRADNDSSKCL